MTFKNLLAAITAAAVLVGCAKSGYQTFYTPYFDAKTSPYVELIAEGEEPKIYTTNNFQRDINILRSKRYVPVGYSSFNGGYEDTDNAAKQAKAVGAKIILISSEYTNTQTSTTALTLPDTQTTYHSGYGNANTTYNSSTGGYLGSSNTTGTYSGTSTTYGTKTVPITTHQRRYDQSAVYFVKSTQKLKYGLMFNNLNPEQRAFFQRNTGVIVEVVIEDTPAFYANVLPGDLLIKVDENPVHNIEHATKILKSTPGPQSILSVIRNGEEKEITVTF
ncbi:PDZ domain-containing protein [Colwellia chukchiensis]|uniref:PDZ domain-containing protein n=1 Tax=Colwellia chukchiensis TaxID=641665 RepID=A0A1H7U047_9GAMM|nr:PDZ domain-containing protein [Colwellia chukchiensis]SEL90058.1 PDZ domain-containing protein [Colwellia chukchiensis]